MGWDWDRKRSAFIDERVAVDGGCCQKCTTPIALQRDQQGLWRGGQVHHQVELADGGTDDHANQYPKVAIGPMGFCLALMAFMPSLWTTALVVCAFFFFDLSMPDAQYFAAFVVLVVASVSFIGIGMMMSVLPLISPEKGTQLGFVAQGTLLVVSGVYYPVDVLPQWMQWISTISPGASASGRSFRTTSA